jgi:hypothetical protein
LETFKIAIPKPAVIIAIIISLSEGTAVRGLWINVKSAQAKNVTETASLESGFCLSNP